ncbi:hypothetical protein ACFLU5_15135, partial [Bacteroidota bacterium]
VENISDDFLEDPFLEKLENNSETRTKFIETIQTFSNSNILRIEHGQYVLGNITTLNNGKRIVVHIMNYDDIACENVTVKLKLKELNTTIARNRVEAFSPDFTGEIISEIITKGNSLEFQIPKLETYSIIIVNL